MGRQCYHRILAYGVKREIRIKEPTGLSFAGVGGISWKIPKVQPTHAKLPGGEDTDSEMAEKYTTQEQIQGGQKTQAAINNSTPQGEINKNGEKPSATTS